MTDLAAETAVSPKHPSLFRRLMPYGVIGGLVSAGVFYPALVASFLVAVEISQAHNYNSNADDFMGGLFCWPAALIVSAGLGMLGGRLGLKLQAWLSGREVNGRSWPALLLAAVGGLLGPALFLLPLTVKILQSWAAR